MSFIPENPRTRHNTDSWAQGPVANGQQFCTQSSQASGSTSFRLIASLLWLSVGLSHGETLSEDFSSDPTESGWLIHGEESLFTWDSTNEVLRVHWDSSQSNSYFHLPLARTLDRQDSFEAAFDIQLQDLATGTTPGKPYTFQLAVSMLDIKSATRTNFFVGSGTSTASGPRSTVEFDYFPAYEDPMYGDITSTFALIAVPTNTNPFLYQHDFPRDLDIGVWHRIALRYSAKNGMVTLSKTRAGVPYGTVQSITLPQQFGGFHINTFAIASYCDKVGLGSLNAHGAMDNIEITLPDPPISSITLTLTNGPTVQCRSQAGWLYTLERGQTPGTWSSESTPVSGTGDTILLTDTNPPLNSAFYRVRAERE